MNTSLLVDDTETEQKWKQYCETLLDVTKIFLENMKIYMQIPCYPASKIMLALIFERAKNSLGWRCLLSEIRFSNTVAMMCL